MTRVIVFRNGNKIMCFESEEEVRGLNYDWVRIYDSCSA